MKCAVTTTAQFTNEQKNGLLTEPKKSRQKLRRNPTYRAGRGRVQRSLLGRYIILRFRGYNGINSGIGRTERRDRCQNTVNRRVVNLHQDSLRFRAPDWLRRHNKNCRKATMTTTTTTTSTYERERNQKGDICPTRED